MTGQKDNGAGPQADHHNRMSAEDRYEMLLEGAVQFFAANGFRAPLRDLAAGLGVSMPLLYRYFDSKEDLAERVYERNFISRWRDEWAGILSDRSRPLPDRLREFYLSNLAVVDRPEWIRIALHSGLDGNALTKRYIERQVGGLLELIAAEVEAETPGTPPGTTDPETLMERVWHLHSTFIYYLVRKHVMQTWTVADHARLVEVAVGNFTAGLAADG